MHHFIDRIIAEPVMDFILFAAFGLSLMGFHTRVRRDEKKRKDKILRDGEADRPQ